MAEIIKSQIAPARKCRRPQPAQEFSTEEICNEKWLPVVGYEGLYEISDLGQVKSLARKVKAKTNVIRNVPTKIMRQIVNKNGYMSVNLSGIGPQWRVSTHIILARAFLGPRPQGFEVAHEDGNRTNCRLSNLSYKTPLENMKDKRKHGTHHFGETVNGAVLTEQEIHEIRVFRFSGKMIKHIQQIYGTTQSNITALCQGRSWSYLQWGFACD